MHHVELLLTVYAVAIVFLIAAVAFLRSWVVDLQEKASLLELSVNRLYDYGRIGDKTPAVIRKPRVVRKPRVSKP